MDLFVAYYSANLPAGAEQNNETLIMDETGNRSLLIFETGTPK
jgi:hypothetical protein